MGPWDEVDAAAVSRAATLPAGADALTATLFQHACCVFGEHGCPAAHAGARSLCRGLEGMLNQRRKLLQYLRRSKFDKYAVLISRLGLKDSYGPQDRLSQRYNKPVGAGGR